jgi:Protein NO VEIN, C-terminal
MGDEDEVKMKKRKPNQGEKIVLRKLRLKDVASQNAGYDIRKGRKFIEVKSRKGVEHTTHLTLTNPEYEFLKRNKDDYLLYWVDSKKGKILKKFTGKEVLKKKPKKNIIWKIYVYKDKKNLQN